jgi:hypothetical protein
VLIKLATAPISAPLAGFKFILRTILETAERELYDVDNLREQLLVLQVEYESGDVSDEEFRAREADIIARMRVARERQQGLSG